MIDYEEDWIFLLLFQVQGSVWMRAASYASVPALLTVGLIILDRTMLPGLHEDIGMQNLDKSSIWNAMTVVLVFLVGFRTKQGLARFWEGTGLLHQMKGEWFDTVSNIVTFTIGAKSKKPKEVAAFRGTIVRLMSLTHASALEEISGTDAQLPTIDVYGVDEATLRHLKHCVEGYNFNKVEVLLHIMQSTITHAQEVGVLGVPPPILSRVYQTLSRGYVNLLNTKKITDTKFPFPFVQLVSMLFVLETVLLPFVMASTLDHVVWAPLCCFLPLFGLYALNFISIELENPFGIDPNDLPIMVFQQEMNSCLLMLLHPDADTVASMSKTAEQNYEALVKEIKESSMDRTLMRLNTHRLDQRASIAISRSTSRNSLRSNSSGESPGRRGSDPDLHHDRAPMFFSFDMDSNLPEDNAVIRPVHLAGHQGIYVGSEKVPDKVQGSSGCPSPNREDVPTDEALRPPTGEALRRQPSKLSASTLDAHTCDVPVPPTHCHSSPSAVAAPPPPPTTTAAGVRQKEVDLLFADMDDFKKVLRLWTAAMQDQIKELSRGLGAMNKLSTSTNSRGPTRRGGAEADEARPFHLVPRRSGAEADEVDTTVEGTDPNCTPELEPEKSQSVRSSGASEVVQLGAKRTSGNLRAQMSRSSSALRLDRRCRLSSEMPKSHIPSCLSGFPS